MRSLRFAFVAAVIAAPLAARAQETFATLIENEASATVEVAPTVVVFQLSKHFEGETLGDAVREARQFGPALRAGVEGGGL